MKGATRVTPNSASSGSPTNTSITALTRSTNRFSALTTSDYHAQLHAENLKAPPAPETNRSATDHANFRDPPAPSNHYNTPALRNKPRGPRKRHL